MNYCKRGFSISAILLIFLVNGCSSAKIQTPASPASSTPQTSTARLPIITSSSAAHLTQGSNFSYQITATNSPTLYSATGLPAGLAVNEMTGQISGTVMTSQSASVQLTAKNQYGQGALTLFLTPANSPNMVGSTHNCDTSQTAPSAAIASQFTRMVFCDDFDSISSIDTGGTGNAGFNWYTYRLWNGILPTSAYSVANSALTLADSTYTNNWGLTSADVRTGNGQSWTFGYFEARIDFNPTLGTSGQGWPSFWSLSEYKAETMSGDPYGELDFFEAFPQSQSPGDYYGAFGGTVHDWRYDPQAGYTDYINGNGVVASGIDWTQWHVIGCLWVPGQVTWYLDGNPVITQRYSSTTTGTPTAMDANSSIPAPTGVFTVLDTEPKGNMVILGTGPKWPMNVDWVRVWQQ